MLVISEVLLHLIFVDFQMHLLKESRKILKPAEETASLEIPSIRVDDVKLVKHLPGIHISRTMCNVRMKYHSYHSVSF